jgi:hypothetical protein
MPYIEYDEVEATCSDCGRLFRSEEALEAHQIEVHRPVEQSPPRPTSSSSPHAALRCQACGIRLGSREELRRHERLTHSEKSSETAAL